MKLPFFFIMQLSVLLFGKRSTLKSRFWRSILLLFLVIATFLAIAIAKESTSALDRLPSQEIRGVWMTTNDFDILEDRHLTSAAITKLTQANFNTIYPVVWNAGYTKYPSNVARQAGIPFFYQGTEGQDILADVTAQAHRQGLLVIPWFEFGFMAPLGSELLLAHPQWQTFKRNGEETSMTAAGEVAWLNPFHPQVQQFIRDLVLEIVTQYDVDGIQFDDHMSLPNEFGYDKYTIDLYTQETGSPPPSNPQDPTWVRWRADKISIFMVQLNHLIKERKPKTIFSVSPNYYDFAYKMQLQDWLTWVRLCIVDELVVQVYRNDLASFSSKLDRPEMLEAKSLIPTGVGIMTGLRNRPVPMSQIQSQVGAAREQGLGVAFFYYESLWDLTPETTVERQNSFRSLFPNTAVRSL
jgi:uncharacterized lipoprotein YddW (UPF0748 family)